MWVLKLKLESGKQFLGKMAIKHEVTMTGYPLSYYKDKEWLYVIVAGLIFGEEGNKKAFLRDMKRQPEMVKLEMKHDFSIAILRQPLFTEPVYDPKIIRPDPVLIHKSGYHIWHLASFERKVLEKVLAFAEKHLGGEVLKFREEKLSHISITNILPELTKNQKRALEIAIQSGYYAYPKQVENLKVLADKMGISYSTYQAHLKKAEGKIIPEIYRRL